MRQAELVAATLSVAGGAIHGLASPEHFSEWWGYGLFFLAATLAQVLFGLLLLTRGIDTETGLSWDQVRRPLYLAGVLGNLAIMLLWVVTRTVGVPAGPEAGEVEAVGQLDAVSKVIEALLVLVLATLWWRSRDRADRPAPA